ncbi:DNA repair protein RadC [Spirochaetota bacterium]
MNLTLKKNSHMLPVQKCISGEDVKNLSDLEILAIIIGTGIKNNDVIDIASSVLKEFGGLSGLTNSGLREMGKNKGIGLRKAIRIHAAFEIGRRVITDRNLIEHVDSPEAVWKLLLPEMAGLQKEEFRVIVLNNKNHLLKKSVISIGTVSEAIVHPREVFIDAIREGGSSIIVAHNHPSGVLTPSKEDLITTERIGEAGKIIGIPLLDHVIVTNSSYLSMKEGGYLSQN